MEGRDDAIDDAATGVGVMATLVKETTVVV